jgi:hypothetical protein
MGLKEYINQKKQALKQYQARSELAKREKRTSEAAQLEVKARQAKQDMIVLQKIERSKKQISRAREYESKTHPSIAQRFATGMDTFASGFGSVGSSKGSDDLGLGSIFGSSASKGKKQSNPFDIGLGGSGFSMYAPAKRAAPKHHKKVHHRAKSSSKGKTITIRME